MEETTSAIKQSCEDQKKGITTFIEIILKSRARGAVSEEML